MEYVYVFQYYVRIYFNLLSENMNSVFNVFKRINVLGNLKC